MSPIQTRVLPVSDGPSPAIAEAAACLLKGGLVAFPTETVYGLGADGLDSRAVARIYEAKGRPSNNPLILHVSSIAEARALVSHWSEEAQRLAERFWPGPLTLVLPASKAVPEIVRAGNPTVALRCPAHPVALALVRATGRPLAAPSANRSTEVSPTRAEHVHKGLAGRVELILDGGPTSAGLESTILGLQARPFRLLRPGPLGVPELEAVVGPLARFEGAVAAGERQAAPGMAERHYAPKARLRLVPEASLVACAREAAAPSLVVGFGRLPDLPSEVEGRALSLDARRVEAELYALLHEADEAGYREVIFQEPPAGEAWRAVRDRLQRAAAEA